MNNLVGRFLNVGGTRLHYFEQGTGPLVLLVHGFPEISYSWRHQMSALAEAGYRVVAYDQRGYGLSSKYANAEAYRIKPLVDDAVGLVYALGEKTAVIIGHDWGAGVAWSAAWLRPDVFRAVAGLSVPFGGRGIVPLPGSPFGELEPDPLHEALAGPGQNFYQTYFGAIDGAITEMEADLRGWLRGAIYSLSGDGLRPTGMDFNTIDALDLIRGSALCIAENGQMKDRFFEVPALPDWFDEEDLEVFARAFEGSGFAGPLMYYKNLNDSWKDLEAKGDSPLEVPATLIIGDLDICYGWGQEAIAGAAGRIPHYRGTHVLAGCGHWTQQERPDEVNQLLIVFLASLPS